MKKSIINKLKDFAKESAEQDKVLIYERNA